MFRTKQRPPAQLDGASVLSYAVAPQTFGTAGPPVGPGTQIIYLAVAKYDGDPGYYLFACSKDWKVVGDLLYDSADEAMKDAERYYDVSPIVWMHLAE